jgi:chromosome segregation ATPase
VSKETIIGATPEQVNENTLGRLYTVSQNATGGIDCNMYCFIADVKQKDEKIADLEAKLAQAKMNESFEKEKKDNAFKFIEELKQQLEEKGVDLSLARNEIDTLKHNLNIAQEHDNVMCEQYFEKCKHHNQDKISFAVEQLEKVKEYAKNKEEHIYNMYDNTKNTNVVSDYHYAKLTVISNIFKFIDNQIKQLKEMK